MNAAALDSLLALRHGQGTRERALAVDPRMRMITTSAANLRVLDTGGSLPPLLIAPDGPCVIEHYLDLIQKLAENFRVICFDMPGFGFSYPRLNYSFGLKETADALVELMDTLAVKQAVFAFSCANGFFAINLAARYPERVSHLVLAQTPSLQAMLQWTDRIVPKPIKLPFVGQAVMAVTAQRFATSWFDLSLPRESRDKPGFAEKAREAVNHGGCFCLASLVQGLARGTDAELQGVQCPTLLFYGDSDFSHKYTDFSSLNSLIPHTEALALQGCGHFPDLERSDCYAQSLSRFVSA